MEKLDKVIAGLEACNGVGEDCNSCPYAGEAEKCSGILGADTLAVLRGMKGKLAQKVDGDLISRTEALEALKGVIARTGAYGVSVEVILEALPSVEAEPVVHAHWKAVLEPNTVDGYGRPVYHAECSACGCRWGHVKEARTFFKRCRQCGAHMDEEVADGT